MKKGLAAVGLAASLLTGGSASAGSIVLAGAGSSLAVSAEPVIAPYVYIGPDLVRIEPDGSSVYFCAVGTIVYAVVELPSGKGCAYVRELSDVNHNVR